MTQLGPGASAADVLLDPSGRILITGSVGGGLFAHAYVARFTARGELDTSFATGGLYTSSIRIFGSYARSLALQPDGAILMGGGFQTGGDYGGWFVLRLLSGGAPDPSFGTNGVVETDPNGRDVMAEVFDVVVHSNGRILAGGSTETQNLEGPSDFTVARYLQDGAPDESWGDDGLVLTPVLEADGIGADPQTPVHALVLQPDGKVLAIGGGARRGETTMRLVIARYLDDGTLDPTWGDGGLARPDVALDRYLGLDAALQPDGRLVVGIRDRARIGALRILVGAVCGDGVIEAGEGCDDGNALDGDCCSAACAPAADGGSCDDGNACTQGDACSSGACAGVGVPATGCRAAARSGLHVRLLDDDHGWLAWHSLRGDATEATDIEAQRYTLCLFDASSATQPVGRLATATAACGGGPCFGVTPRQTRYADTHGRGGPVRRVVLRAGPDGRAAARLVAQGAAASFPALPLQGPVTAQLHAENGVCWGSTFATPQRNDGTSFDATE